MKYILLFFLVFAVFDLDASYPESSCGSPASNISVVERIIKKMTLEIFTKLTNLLRLLCEKRHRKGLKEAENLPFPKFKQRPYLVFL